MTVSPSIRVPRPVLAGNVSNAGTGTGAKQTFAALARPHVGTAWALEGFSLSVLGPAPTITEDLSVDLLLGGEVIDTFTLDSGVIVAGGTGVYPISIQHGYQSPFTIYDTDTLYLRQNFAETPGAGNVLNYRYVGNVKYL